MRITPFLGTRRVAIPLVGDADAPLERDGAVHDEQLAMRAIVEAAEIVPTERAISVQPHTSSGHLVDERLVHLDAAGPVERDGDRDASGGTLREGIGELATGLAGP